MANLDSQDWRAKYDRLGKRFQDLFRQRMPVLQDYENTVNTSLDNLINETVPAMRGVFRQAQGMQELAEEEYIPAAREYMQKAREYDTPERRQLETQKAMADVGAAGEASRQSAIARLESYGIDPSMTRGAALDQNVRLQTALEQVRAGKEAGQDVEERGQAYARDALGVGSAVQQGALQAAQLGSGLGSTTVGLGNQTASNFANIFGTPSENLGARKDLIDASFNAKVQESQFKAAQGGEGSPWGALGATAGTLAGVGLGAYLGPAGSVAGAQLGAQLGGQLGGTAGSFAAPPQRNQEMGYYDRNSGMYGESMMGVLDAIGQFGMGFTGGSQQGLDLYSQVQQVQEEGQLRQRRKRAEQEIAQLVESGQFKNDPIAATKAGAEIFLKNSDFDNYDKWNSNAQQLTKFEGDRTLMNAFAVAKTDPAAAVPLINKYHGLMGTGTKYDIQRTPEGFRLLTNVGGKPSSKDYTDMDELGYDILSGVEAYALGPEATGKMEVERGKAKVEEAKGTAYAQRLQEQSALAQAKLPSEIAENQASALASRASAGASGATAAAASALARDREALRPGALAQQQLTAAETAKRTANIGVTPKKPEPTMEELAMGLTGDAPTDEFGNPLPSNPFITDEATRAGFSTALQQAVPGLGKNAFYLADRIARTKPEELAKATTNEDGTLIQLSDGTQLPLTDEITNYLQMLKPPTLEEE